MCQGCYNLYGEHKIANDSVLRAAKLIEQVYEFSCVGGNLHIVLDDWNIEDNNVEFCIRAITENKFNNTPEQLAIENECALLLRGMRMEERCSALGLYDKFWRVEETLL